MGRWSRWVPPLLLKRAVSLASASACRRQSFGAGHIAAACCCAGGASGRAGNAGEAASCAALRCEKREERGMMRRGLPSRQQCVPCLVRLSHLLRQGIERECSRRVGSFSSVRGRASSVAGRVLWAAAPLRAPGLLGPRLLAFPSRAVQE